MQTPSERYDTIGTGYGRVRVPDPRIAALIEEALGGAITVVNVGAGAGSYESPGRKVVGVEPSTEMLRQRPRDAAPCIVGRSEALPFLDRAVDACTAFWTVHHWSDQPKGLREMRRVARGPVVLMNYLLGAIPPEARWLSGVYFPHIGRVDETLFPTLHACEASLGPCRVVPVMLPADCIDGFLDAYWARPEAYLEERVRAGISGFRLMPEPERAAGLERLARDLASGAWDERFGHLRHQPSYDAGVRLIVAERNE
ncbi:MAG: class I SAM-dependent methyltransferase [Polyangiaceae bacterium]